MILRITLFQLRPDVTEYDTRMLLATLSGAVKNVPGLLTFNVGKRLSLDSGSRLGTAAEAPGPDYEYAAVFQFENGKALEAYLKHPARAALRARLEAVVTAATTSDYEI